MMTRYLVTGGAGFIGSNIVHELIKQGKQVRVLDNFNTGKRKNIRELQGDMEIIGGDFTDDETVAKAVKDGDVIIHQGDIPSVPKSIQDPIQTNHANITGTLKLLHAAAGDNVKRFVYASSSSAYGFNQTLPQLENMPGSPMSPYAVSRYTGVYYCNVVHDIFGLETMSLRCISVFGPRQSLQSTYAAVIPAFIEAILNDQSTVIYGDGRQSRDFTYVEDIVSANLLAAEAPKLQGEVINIGTGSQIVLNDLVNDINAILGENIPAKHT